MALKRLLTRMSAQRVRALKLASSSPPPGSDTESDQRYSLAVAVIGTLREHGHQAYLVGGCVRDRLLQIPPKDYDVSTDATPDLLLSYFPGAQTVGAHFGVILVTAAPGVQVEVATFRSEGVYHDGRRPEKVSFETDPARDAHRRDFTINGLMQDPESLQVLDFVDGQKDLQQGLIRAIGDPRIAVCRRPPADAARDSFRRETGLHN